MSIGNDVFKLEGIKEMQGFIRNLDKDKDKKRVIQNIYAKQLKAQKPRLESNTPVADKDVRYRGSDKFVRTGNLRRSMNIYRGKGKENLMVFMGAKIKSKNAHETGYYSHMVQYGTKPSAGNSKGIKGNNFIQDTMDIIKPELTSKAAKGTVSYLVRLAKRHGVK